MLDNLFQPFWINLQCQCLQQQLSQSVHVTKLPTDHKKRTVTSIKNNWIKLKDEVGMAVQ